MEKRFVRNLHYDGLFLSQQVFSGKDNVSLNPLHFAIFIFNVVEDLWVSCYCLKHEVKTRDDKYAFIVSKETLLNNYNIKTSQKLAILSKSGIFT